MSRSQARAARRHRGKTYPGPLTPEDAAIRLERGRRIAATISNYSALAEISMAEAAAKETAPRQIPTGGAARRRAKAARNNGTLTPTRTRVNIIWCPENPCKGVCCPRTQKWAGHATMGVPRPAGTEAEKATALAEFAEDIARAKPEGPDGRPRLVPPGTPFEVHDMLDKDANRYWFALYAGEEPPQRVLAAAEEWSEQGAAANVAAAREALAQLPPPVRSRVW